jgi:hypothetical protein
MGSRCGAASRPRISPGGTLVSAPGSARRVRPTGDMSARTLSPGTNGPVRSRRRFTAHDPRCPCCPPHFRSCLVRGGLRRYPADRQDELAVLFSERSIRRPPGSGWRTRRGRPTTDSGEPVRKRCATREEGWLRHVRLRRHSPRLGCYRPRRLSTCSIATTAMCSVQRSRSSTTRVICTLPAYWCICKYCSTLG